MARVNHDRPRERGELAQELEDLDLVLYTGKGGVGKTTTAAATALRSAELGRRTLVVSADPAHSLGDVLQRPLASRELAEALEPDFDGADLSSTRALPAVEVTSKLFALELDARPLVRRHWARIHDYLAKLFTHHGIDAGIASELATLPGAFELAVLLAVDRAVTSAEYDLVVVDLAPTASALRMTTLPDVARGMLKVVLGALRGASGIAGPLAQRMIAAPLPDADVFESVQSLLYRNLTSLRRRLVAPSTAVRLVVTPERMVIDEARRAYTDLCLFELSVDAVVINRVLEDVAGAEPQTPFLREMFAAQTECMAEIATCFAPLPTLQAPFCEDELVGPARLALLAEAMFGDRAPGGRLAPAHANLRFEGHADAPTLCLAMPGVAPGDLEVVKVDGDLIITTPRRRRSIPLPRRVARLSLLSARLEAGQLEVAFGLSGPETPCG